jgi:hypothetical protein
MPAQNAMFIVEGPQDALCLGCLLADRDFTRIRKAAEVPDPWRNLVNPTFPAAKRGIDQAHEVPHFYRAADGAIITVILAGGDGNLAPALLAQLKGLKDPQGSPFTPQAIGYLLDRDHTDSPADRHTALLAKLTALGVPIPFPPQPGTVLPGPPRTGVFILPDNQNPGTLETILLETGAVAYTPQLQQAEAFVEHFDTTGLDAEDLDAGSKPSGRKKQIIGTVAAMLKPGRALATTLQDNRWLKGDALNTPLAIGLRKWLHELLDLPSP